MKLIVGLGNPGKKYDKTRHNMGFLVLDLLAEWAKVDIDKNDFKGKFARFKRNDEDVVLFKPETYMNLSGEAVLAITQFFKIDADDIVVVLDDIALDAGRIRLREKGSSGGQKGLQNIITLLHTNEIKRIRIGTGEPPVGEIVDYVLSKPSKEDWDKISPALIKARDALIDYLDFGFSEAMNKFNKGDS
ncbi:MAG: aminoacyl-tRNA hydrolase [Bacilli bacterium]|nr:aminoacyl-tRNA hydrolase [Bacilli bacterium]MDD3389068.1 aminoacyl-tRNA hydrolase [Bacilli bacterium]MDD4344707.1 aminoacyl-tRNA hydrolase [Bacilli bacterium]MDD4520848.1 aminoacyl-tRNA hydrolase [Bacilli bacterium]MDY0399640.1 aminoacyl-tRNA hydrolase [Bacilli bacterium]